ncbi:hypothetical protein DEU56DRAFT_874374 [Suillus clintonianus]|uniref:uncharacterized protein n=1 Tax=Suillus clintonianus TaxID=1904413 RepID=UPI001B85F4A4|nr:uncharacterized protein DEU56DRAFT_874374 [Suillus clintonianus]KAG2112434.1 hypothetical protein DEU56DRAFT_874374 [Suillus clintonianus]
MAEPHGFRTHCTACAKLHSIAVNVPIDAHRAAEQADNLNQQHQATRHNVDDIQTEYHPNSGIPAQTRTFSTFQRNILEDPPIPDTQPWAAELAHEAALSQPQIDRLINLLHCSKQDSESFTLRNYKDVRNAWSAISHRLTPFKKQTIQVPYDGVDQQFTLYYRDLWDWACDLLRDPYIGPQFTFDTQRLSKFDGNTFSSMPGHAKPLAFILYAVKAKLSSFGVGGGLVVAWLPIVKDDASKSGKQKFADFKATVWHKSFKQILKCLKSKRKRGGWVECWDKSQCLSFPFVPILSADYEEQCVMSLIRGVMGKFLCPICLVPRDELHSLLNTWPLRTCRSSVRLLRKARGKSMKAKREKKLKSQLLRDVELLDVFRALCFDRPHTHHEGLWGKHLWIELQKRIHEASRQAVTMIDEGFAAAPRWRNLNHFNGVMGISFADGTKYEDILKLIVFVAHDVLDPEVHELGYLLLRCIRAHLDVDMFPALEVHTMETLAAGRGALGEFSRLMDKYMSKCGSEVKNWNFPKHHLSVHLFEDIKAKGVTRNFNTKPNEKAHRPLKKSYQLRTNFKQVADQILCADHWSLVSAWICYRLNDLDDYNARKEASALGGSDLDLDADDTAPDETVNMPRSESSFHIKLGSRQCISSINAIQQAHLEDPAFHQFHTKLNRFLNTIPIITRNGCVALELDADTVTEFCYLKANFESTVDFRTSKDYLRYSPMFHNAPRYDSVISHLIFVFMCLVGDASYPMALIHPCDAPIQNRPLKDRHLGLWQVRAQPWRKSEFVFADSIIREALLLEDCSQPGDFFVVDSVDTDMFLCMKLHKDSHIY